MAIVSPSDHGPGWEYLYFASEIARGLAKHQAQYADYQAQTVHLTGERPSTDPAAHLRGLSDEIVKTVDSVTTLLSPQTLENAFGAPGAPGNEAAIREVARGLVDVYSKMIAWGERVRGASVPPEWEPVYRALAKYVGLPLHQIQDFSAVLSSGVGRVVGDLRAGKQPTDTLTLTLEVTIDPAAVSEFGSAMAALRASARAPPAPVQATGITQTPAHIYTDVRSWYDDAMPQLKPLMAAEAKIGAAFSGGAAHLDAVAGELRRSSEQALAWIAANPCPDEDLAPHISALATDYDQLGRFLHVATSAPDSDADRITSQVRELQQDILGHTQAIDRWQPPPAQRASHRGLFGRRRSR